jgi:hypothetical protein
VHPDGRTIFASSSFTFSLDTQSEESARRGDWRLPFHGRVYYDSHLDAWVREGALLKDTPTCVLDVPTLAIVDRTTLPEPAWKICKEVLQFIDAPARPRSPMLVHTGCGEFCLVEVREGATARVTKFCAERAKNGELEVTPYCPGRSYLVPNYCGRESAYCVLDVMIDV